MIIMLFNERLAGATVNADFKLAVKPDMTQILGLLNSRQFIKLRKIHHITFASVRINIYVAGVERCKVLEEMGSLAGVHAEILKAALHYDLCFGYIAPLHRNTQ